MKTQISRDSFDPAKRYSGVYLQQGRMIVDADVNELTDISKDRLDRALADAIGTGAPRAGALAIVKNGANVSVHPGHVYADGIGARLDGAADVPVTAQPDYRNAPALPANNVRFYADVWERAVTAVEDDALQDPGLHGADTATRSKTMLQVKWCDRAIDVRDPAVNPAIGNALLTLTLRLIKTTADQCDPCAVEVAVDERIGNYLFRVEVHDVFSVDVPGDPDPAKRRQLHVVLKWSRDNGAEAYPANALPSGFDQGDWVWEFFDGDSENLLGHHFPAGAPLRRGVIVQPFAAPANPQPNAFVRQWDGFAELNLTTGALVAGRDRGAPLSTALAADAHAFATIDAGAGTVLLNLELLELALTYAAKTLVAGDFWQIAVREAVDTSGEVVLGDGGGALPHGVRHHYAELAQIDNAGNLVAFSDSFRRRMSFPPLTDLRAADVGFGNHCSDLFGTAQNVQAALDALCNIDASDIGYAVPGCGTAAAPSVASLMASTVANFPDLDGVPKSPSVKDILDALMCHLDAQRLPYDGTAQGARWSDISEGAAAPLTVQQALDQLAANLDSGDIGHDVAECVDPTGSGSQTVRQLLGVAAGRATIADLLDRLYCQLRATHVPLDRSKLACADLATDPAVVTVQDALDKLCQTASSGCEITIAVGNLEKRLRDFAASDVPDIALCLLPGEHTIGEDLVIDGKRSVRIAAASPVATTVSVKKAFSVGATDIVLEGVGFSLPAAGGLDLRGDHVTGERCSFGRISGGPHLVPLVRIGARTQPAQLQWRGNAMSDIWFRGRPNVNRFVDPAIVGDARTAKAFDRLTSDVTLFGDRKRLDAALDEIADSVAAMPADARKSWGTRISAQGVAPSPAIRRAAKRPAAKAAAKTSTGRSAKKTTARPLREADAIAAAAAAIAPRMALAIALGGVFTRPGAPSPIVINPRFRPAGEISKPFVDTISAAAPTRDDIRGAIFGDGTIAGAVDVLFDSGVNVALGVSSHRSSGTLAGNWVNGEIVLMNDLELTGATNVGVDIAAKISSVNKAIELVRPGGGQLDIDGNNVDRLWSLAPVPDGAGNLAGPIDGCSACTFTANQLTDLKHSIVSRKLAVSDNHFDALPQANDLLIARMLVNQVAVVGNLSADLSDGLRLDVSSKSMRASANFFVVQQF